MERVRGINQLLFTTVKKKIDFLIYNINTSKKLKKNKNKFLIHNII